MQQDTEVTFKWLATALLGMAGGLIAVIWWAAQSDAAIKANTNNHVRTEARMDAIQETLNLINKRLITIEVRSETRDDVMLDRLNTLTKQLRVD